MYLYQTEVNSGYALKHSVSFSKWGVYVSSAGIQQDFNMDHGAGGPYWDYTIPISKYHRYSGYAKVNGGSFAAMVNGGMCYSGLPQDFHDFH